MPDKIDDLIKCRSENSIALRKALRQAARSALDGDPLSSPRLKDLLSVSSFQDVLPSTLRALQHLNISTGRYARFSTQIVGAHDRHLSGYREPSWYVDNKIIAHKLASSVGLKVPNTDFIPRRWDDLTFSPGTVIKPAHGAASLGVYAIRPDRTVIALQDGAYLPSLSALRTHAEDSLRRRGRSLTSESWLVEEMISTEYQGKQPARNAKVFTFYGHAVLLRQTERTDALRMAHWDSEGLEVTPLTKHTENLVGAEFPQCVAEKAIALSLEVPTPFMRIDFLEGPDGPVFGEITPWPGTFHAFTDDWDLKLGQAWFQAEDRLKQDLLFGKRFSSFLRITDYETGRTPDYPS